MTRTQANIVEREWTTVAGLTARCLFVNDSHRCGYVRVPEDSPLYGKTDNEPSPLGKDVIENRPVGKRGVIDLFLIAARGEHEPLKYGDLFDVHGSITFSGELADVAGWWFGFDCAHAGDKTRYWEEGEVRTQAYVEAECESLARQLIEWADMINRAGAPPRLDEEEER